MGNTPKEEAEKIFNLYCDRGGNPKFRIYVIIYICNNNNNNNNDRGVYT